MSRADGSARRVVVTGIGVISALGDSPAALFESLTAGRSALGPVELFDASGCGCREAAGIGDFNPSAYLEDRSLHPLDRTSRLAASAAQLALRSSDWDTDARDRDEVGLVLGTMFGSVHTISEFDRKAIESGPAYAKPMAFANSVINAAAGQTAIWHNLRGVNATVSGGAGSGLQALSHAADLIRLGRADVVLAGGVEELCFESFYGFDRAGLLGGSRNGDGGLPVPFDARRNGFILGEAAALLVLEELESARGRGASPVAEILGHGHAFDCCRGRDPVAAADALAHAVRSALDDAAVDPEMVAFLSASANGSIDGDLVEARGVATALGSRVERLPVTAIKSMLGETLGAGGALQAIVAIETMRSRTLPGIRGLEDLDGRVALRGARPESSAIGAGVGLVTSLGLTGGHCSIVVGLQRDEPAARAFGGRVVLVPRLEDQGYEPDQVSERRAWAEEMTGARLSHVGACSIPTAEMRGNIENPIGSVQTPLGLAGPLRLRGEHADGTFYVPLATTEGALVRSYERGMVALTRAGGATARVHVDENRVAPLFTLAGVAEAAAFCAFLDRHFGSIKAAAESTTAHGKLLRLEPRVVGRDVIVAFCYSTGDAHGMNMIAKATDEACRWIVERGGATTYTLFSGFGSEKRASGALLAGGKGKTVTAGASLSASITSSYLHAAPEQLVELWRQTVVGHLQAHVLGYNGHYANGLAAIFIACGQDVANVANSSVGITNFSMTPEGGLYVSVTLPSLSVATVGGGTGLGTSAECLRLLGCAGDGKARKLAEIVAATLLAGEISMGAALASGEFVGAHEALGRNRPG